MCWYAQIRPRTHYVCTGCRRSVKSWWARTGVVCTECRGVMVNAGPDFAAPRRRDDGRWRAVEAVLAAGLRYDGRDGCGCGADPKPRPRTSAQVRRLRRAADRAGRTRAEALALPDPADAVGSPRT